MLGGRPGGRREQVDVARLRHALVGRFLKLGRERSDQEIGQSRGKTIEQRDLHALAAYEDIPPPGRRREIDRVAHHLRLVDRRRRARQAGSAGDGMGVERRVDRGRVDHADVDPAALVDQLRADCLGKPAHRKFSARIGRLYRHAAEADCRADIHDGTGVARAHVLQRNTGAVHAAHVGDVGDPAELLIRHVGELREHTDAGVVHPNVERPHAGHDRGGGGMQGGIVGDICRERLDRAATFGQLRFDVVERHLAAGDEGHAPATLNEQPRGAATDAGRTSGNNGEAGGR